MLISFEGTEGMGKSTQLLRLEKYLRDSGKRVMRTFEPGDTKLGQQLRSLLLDHTYNPTSRTELLLYAADRAQHVDKVIRPILEMPETVILCDRYTDATVAYQGGGRGFDDKWLQELNHFATGGIVPTLTFLFDGDPRLGLQRARGRSLLDRIESEEVSFFERVRQRYLHLAASEPDRFVIVDAEQNVDEIEASIQTAVQPHIETP